MTKNIINGLFVALLGSVASGSAILAPCVDGNLSSYLALGSTGCEVGDKIFSNFTYVSSAQGGAVAITADGITVDDLGPIGSGADLLSSNIGLQFNANWTATAGQVLDSNIGFMVTVVNGSGYAITDSGVAQLASGVSGNGSVTVAEVGCGPVPCTLGSPWQVFTFNDGTSTSQLGNDTIISPTGSVMVSKDIGVSGGTDGAASLSLLSDTFSQTAVPEPGTLGGIGVVLVGLGLIGGRKFPQRTRR